MEQKTTKEKECLNRSIEIESKSNAHKSLENYIIEYEETLQKSYETSSEENRQLKEKYEKENKILSELNEIFKHQIIICKKIERIVIKI